MENTIEFGSKFLNHVTKLYNPENRELLISERDKQEKLREMSMVPRAMDPNSATFESLGFKFSNVEDDPLLCYVTLPDGWRLVSSNNVCESFVYDENANKRVSIKFIATGLERCGKMKLLSRYQVKSKSNILKSEDCIVAVDTMTDTIIYSSESEYNMPPSTIWKELQKAHDYLNEHFPDWENPTAYWN